MSPTTLICMGCSPPVCSLRRQFKAVAQPMLTTPLSPAAGQGLVTLLPTFLCCPFILSVLTGTSEQLFFLLPLLDWALSRALSASQCQHGSAFLPDSSAPSQTWQSCRMNTELKQNAVLLVRQLSKLFRGQIVPCLFSISPPLRC